MQSITAVVAQAYGRPLEAVLRFKYLGRVLTASDDNWLAVFGNPRKARRRWTWMLRILRWKGSDPWEYGKFYKAVVQPTLLFGAEIWVMSARIGRTLGGLHHKVACRMEKMQ